MTLADLEREIERLKGDSDRDAATLNAQANTIRTLRADVAQLREALREIVAWRFPPVTDRDGKRSTMGIEYGSNGERDFMRNVARKALAATEPGA